MFLVGEVGLFRDHAASTVRRRMRSLDGRGVRVGSREMQVGICEINCACVCVNAGISSQHSPTMLVSFCFGRGGGNDSDGGHAVRAARGILSSIGLHGFRHVQRSGWYGKVLFTTPSIVCPQKVGGG